MKKLTAIALTAAMLLSLSACGGVDNSQREKYDRVMAENNSVH